MKFSKLMKKKTNSESLIWKKLWNKWTRSCFGKKSKKNQGTEKDGIKSKVFPRNKQPLLLNFLSLFSKWKLVEKKIKLQSFTDQKLQLVFAFFCFFWGFSAPQLSRWDVARAAVDRKHNRDRHSRFSTFKFLKNLMSCKNKQNRWSSGSIREN